MLRYKLVWTIHDLIPHGEFFVNEALITKLLAKLSDTKIVHSEEVIKQMKFMKIDTSNCRVIPHGNYIGYYPNNQSKKIVTNKSNNMNQEFVFGFFGNIRKDKGVIKLVESYISCNLKNAKLILAGKPENNEVKTHLIKLSKHRKDIIFNFSYISGEKIQSYINKFDIFVCPFINITTSGSVVLAMSFKKPIISPNVGDLLGYPRNTGYYYDKNNSNALCKSMKKAFFDRKLLKEMGENSFTFISKNTWKKSAALTVKVYKEVLA